MKSKIQQLLTYRDIHPKKRYSYAVTAGVFVGEILVYTESTPENHYFLSIPKMVNREVPVEKFREALTCKLVDIVEKLPKSVYKVCYLQYKKNNPPLSNHT